jgi:hypothetical protein
MAEMSPLRRQMIEDMTIRSPSGLPTPARRASCLRSWAARRSRGFWNPFRA